MTKTVICMIDDRTLPAQDCLTCALEHQHPPCGLDYGLLAAMLHDAPRPAIHVTDLTGCLRRAWYSKRDPQPEYVHAMLSRHLGTFFHASVEISDEHTQSEVPVAWEDVVGTTDRFYVSNGRVVDYKTSKYIYPDRSPSAEHALQVNIYAYMLRKSGYRVESLAIQYVSLSGPSQCRKCYKTVVFRDGRVMCPKCGRTPNNAHPGWLLVEVPLMADDEIEAIFNERRGVLASALNNGHLPPAEPGWVCAYCSAAKVCTAGSIQLNGYE